MNMHAKLFSALILTVCGLGASVIAADRIQLPAPAKSGGPALAQTLADRQSNRNFANSEITQQQLADLLWSTAGLNRPGGKTTYPVSMGRQDMSVYVFTRSGVYRYDPAANALDPIAAGDHRADTGTQPFVGDAAVNLAYVQDLSLWEDTPEAKAHGPEWGFVHTGAMVQNAYLYAAGQGWAAVVRAWFKEDQLKKLLKLSDKQVIKLVQSLGPKK